MWALTELVEARDEERRDASWRATRSSGSPRPRSRAGTDWALGIEARSRALLSEGEAAERLYREAIERLGRTRLRPELARAHLLYGEWLRREGRRVDAREQLRAAHEQLAAIGMEAFAERARRELQATGEKVRKRTVETRDELTAAGGADRAACAATASRTPRSARGCSSARARSSGTCARCSPSSGSHSRRELASALPDSESQPTAA